MLIIHGIQLSNGVKLVKRALEKPGGGIGLSYRPMVELPFVAGGVAGDFAERLSRCPLFTSVFTEDRTPQTAFPTSGSSPRAVELYSQGIDKQAS